MRGRANPSRVYTLPQDPIPSKEAVRIGDFSQGSAVSVSSLPAREETTPAVAGGPLPPFDVLP